MKRIAVCILVLGTAMPFAANAQFRPVPGPLPPSGDTAPGDFGRGEWDTRAQDKWDRRLRDCLNDRRQSRRERRACADAGMPVKARRKD